jgi:hypothetical protein
MTDQPSWRRADDALECNVAPQVEALVRTGEFSHTTAAIARARRLVRNQMNGIAARLWHLINLPASSDERRMT